MLRIGKLDVIKSKSGERAGKRRSAFIFSICIFLYNNCIMAQEVPQQTISIVNASKKPIKVELTITEPTITSVPGGGSNGKLKEVIYAYNVKQFPGNSWDGVKSGSSSVIEAISLKFNNIFYPTKIWNITVNTLIYWIKDMPGANGYEWTVPPVRFTLQDDGSLTIAH